MPCVEIKNLSKSFLSLSGNVTVFENFHFSVDSNKIVAIIGPSGCGKTTLLNLLAGLEQPTKGEILINSKEPIHLQKSGKIGMAFQDPSLLPWRNVEQNINLPLEIQSKKNEERIVSLLKLFQITGATTKYPYELSGGMRQRVAFARALVSEPEILLLDEPFSSVHESLRDTLMEELEKQLTNKHYFTFIVTHSILEAAFLADLVIVLSPSPCKIIHQVFINFPRPRLKGLLYENAFIEECKNIKKYLEDEKV